MNARIPIQVTNPEFIRAEATRITQLYVHAVIAIVFGILILQTPPQSTSFKIVEHLWGWSWLYGSISAAGGVWLFIDLLRKKTRNISGPLLVILGVHGFLAALFVINAIRFLFNPVRTEPVIYPIALYVGFAVLILLQLLGAKEQGERRGD